MTITSNEHSRIFSHGTLKLNVSLNTGFNVHLNIGVFRFSIRFSPNCSHTFTYGSVNRKIIILKILSYQFFYIIYSRERLILLYGDSINSRIVNASATKKKV